MSESEFAKKVVQRLVMHGNRVLRVCDGTDARHGKFGLRAITSPIIKATGADYLVIPHDGMKTVLARAFTDVHYMSDEPYFLELKDPKAPKLKQFEQERWLRWVGEQR